MKIAPIQLGEVSYRRVNIELDASRLPEDGTPPKNISFDCDGVDVATHVSFSQSDGAGASGAGFFLALRVVIANASDEEDARFSPYLVDIEAGSPVRTLPGSEVLADIEDIVLVNGTSLLWSAIREQVCNLTARMPAGILMLPTVNFVDLKRGSREGTESEEKEAMADRRQPGKKPRKTIDDGNR